MISVIVLSNLIHFFFLLFGKGLRNLKSHRNTCRSSSLIVKATHERWALLSLISSHYHPNHKPKLTNIKKIGLKRPKRASQTLCLLIRSRYSLGLYLENYNCIDREEGNKRQKFARETILWYHKGKWELMVMAHLLFLSPPQFE